MLVISWCWEWELSPGELMLVLIILLIFLYLLLSILVWWHSLVAIYGCGSKGLIKEGISKNWSSIIQRSSVTDLIVYSHCKVIVLKVWSLICNYLWFLQYLSELCSIILSLWVNLEVLSLILKLTVVLGGCYLPLHYLLVGIDFLESHLPTSVGVDVTTPDSN